MPVSPKHPYPHPDPPADVNTLRPLIKRVQGPWIRFYLLSKKPLEFDHKNTHRFNAPDGEYGILYVALNHYGAFIETYGQPTGIRAVTYEELSNRSIAELCLSCELKVVDITGRGLASVGADDRLCSSGDYKVSQKWALALWNHPKKPDGILYRCRHDPSKKALGLFDRVHVKEALSYENKGVLSSFENIELMAKILKHYKFSLLMA